MALVQEPVANQSGLSFYFTVNEVPIFIKVRLALGRSIADSNAAGQGANWVPADSWEQRVTP